MDAGKGGALHKVFVPEGALSELFFAKDGFRWKFQPAQQRRFGVFSKTVHVLERSPNAMNEELSELFKALVLEQLKGWEKDSGREAIQELARKTRPILDLCMADASRDFRKELIRALGVQGAAIFKAVLADRFEEIGKLYESKKENGRSASFTGILPPGIRAKWSVAHDEAVYDLFLIESPPEVRRVFFSIEDGAADSYKLSFPWICFFVLFKNGNLCRLKMGNTTHAFWAFYRNSPIVSEQDVLYMPNLPHVGFNWPHQWCLGNDIPHIKLSDPKWCETLLGWFWQSEFLTTHASYYFEEACERIAEVASPAQWEETSLADPARILELPWKELGKTVAEFASDAMDLFVKDTLEKQSRQALDGIVEKIRERVEEEMFFLVDHFTIPNDMEKSAEEVLATELHHVAKVLERSLLVQSTGIATQLAEEYFALNNITDTKRSANVSNMDS